MISEVNGKIPKIDPSAFVAPGAVVVGDVTLGALSNIWYGCILRGDVNYISIGERSSIQDGTVVHVNYGGPPTLVGQDVVVGHRVILHGCQVEDGCLIGMGSVLLDGARVEPEAWVAAGALVPPGMVVPARTVAAGVPAKIVRDLRPAELKRREGAVKRYLLMTQWHSDPQGSYPNPQDLE